MVDRIESALEFDDYVYDFTVEHPRNFIAIRCAMSMSKLWRGLIRTNLDKKQLEGPKGLLRNYLKMFPVALDASGKIRLNPQEEKQIQGARWAVERESFLKTSNLRRLSPTGMLLANAP